MNTPEITLPPSILTKSQKKTFRKELPKGDIILATVRFDDECGNRHNSFAITGELYDRERIPGEAHVENSKGKKRYLGSCGCLHDDIAKHFPELAPLIKWHLVSSDGPMHYVANVVYHAGDRDCNGLRKGEFCQHTSRGPRQNGGIQGVPNWVLEIPEGVARDIYAAEKPAPVTIEWKPYGRTGEGKVRDLAAARNAAVWPEATDDELCQEPEALTASLLARLPALMVEFKAAVESLGFTY